MLKCQGSFRKVLAREVRKQRATFDGRDVLTIALRGLGNTCNLKHGGSDIHDVSQVGNPIAFAG